MLIKSALIAGSEQRFKQAKFSPAELDKKLGDGPMEMTVQQKQRRQRQFLAQLKTPRLPRPASSMETTSTTSTTSPRGRSPRIQFAGFSSRMRARI
jgi:hypothetical protein